MKDIALYFSPKRKKWPCRLKAATSVNSEMLAFYWSLGRDIVEMKAESQWGSQFYDRLSQDLQREIQTQKDFLQQI